MTWLEDLLTEMLYQTITLLLMALIGLAAQSVGAHVIPRNAARYLPTVIREVRYYWGIRQHHNVFMGQIHQESAFREGAKSAFASGLTQFTPSTAAWIQGLYAADLRELCPDRSGCPLDAKWAIRSMVLYDKRLYDGHGFSSGDDRWAFTLAAYNGGLGWLKIERGACAALAGCDPSRYFHHVELLCGKSTPRKRAAWACEENRTYPRRILFKWRPLYR